MFEEVWLTKAVYPTAAHGPGVTPCTIKTWALESGTSDYKQ